MLSLLKIRNLALVDELTWEPESGFLSITGETGAGKSVIMGGISLVMGERADKGRIRSGETQCSIEAIFHLSKPQYINAQLEEAGVPPCEENALVIRRIITAGGNRQFINNSPVTLHLLRQIGSGLVDMHHPEAHRSLTSQERQLDLLDAFAENSDALQTYRQAYVAWQTARRAYRELMESEMASERELDFLRHQVQEIESAGFTAEEASELEADWQRARNAGKLRDTAMPMAHMIDGGDDSILSRLRQLVRSSRDLERLDADCAAWLAPLPGIVDELEELSARLQDYTDTLCGDPAELARLEERISTLDTLKRKYGTDFEAIQEHLTECLNRLAAIDNREELMQQQADEERARYADLKIAAAGLSETRRKAAPKLAEDFLTHARQLGFRQSLFDVTITPLSEPGPHGAETVDFLFGPNPGEPLKALRLIASSGELARVMLALKSALAHQDDTPLLIFDEIDANVGGEIARAVGRKMRELGNEHQVISITHFPQVAALANHHYLIAKTLHDGRTVSRLSKVSGEQRVEELMRMLGTGGEAARAHAEGLLEENDKKTD
ncbi:MAG: DNA repair protein RecN [Akkermansia sp.]|nr:DNA repair protein RecN [Akkermansia sp.]